MMIRAMLRPDRPAAGTGGGAGLVSVDTAVGTVVILDFDC